jgi:hypothetical protein
MMFEDYSAKAAGCQGVTHMGRKGQRRQDLALETAMPPALIRRGPATGNGGICVSCAPQLLCEQPNAPSTFVERASESKTTSTEEVGTLKQELMALRLAAVDMALRESNARRESEDLRKKTRPSAKTSRQFFIQDKDDDGGAHGRVLACCRWMRCLRSKGWT